MIFGTGLVALLSVASAFAESQMTAGATFCRFVPERSDDFAWENDNVAFRVYGPALAKGAEKIQEVKTITIELGKRLFTSESAFTENGNPADLEIAVGLTTHDQRGVATLNPDAGWMSCLKAFAFVNSPIHVKVMSREQIIAEAEKMALIQFDAMGWNFWGRFWMDGVCFAGVVDLANVSDNPKFFEAIKKLGQRDCGVSGKNYGPWCLLYIDEKNEPHHADDMCIAQAFLDYYAKTRDPKVLEDTRRRVDAATEHMLSPESDDKGKRADQMKWNEGMTWYWCDALFMAAPVHARLSDLTGDPKYLKAMHAEWARASDLLYDSEEHLFFRDAKHFPRKTANGKKLFWSRGNGWVMGALARILPSIPQDDPQRPFYIQQFKEMSDKLASIQRPDGTWSPSLLDFEQFPYSETSGTALNCFAIAWGINKGFLDDKTYWYGNGAFYMAAVQLAEMAPLNLPAPPVLTAAKP